MLSPILWTDDKFCYTPLHLTCKTGLFPPQKCKTVNIYGSLERLSVCLGQIILSNIWCNSRNWQSKGATTSNTRKKNIWRVSGQQVRRWIYIRHRCVVCIGSENHTVNCSEQLKPKPNNSLKGAQVWDIRDFCSNQTYMDRLVRTRPKNYKFWWFRPENRHFILISAVA